ncbi:hypothetical protein EV363DRAFT_1163673 [Boletus edulis]|nr:hypothetical protein EV363DRAFT_1163673 [Boletus edulis]
MFTFQGHLEFTDSIVRQLMILIPEFADELGPELVEDGLLRVRTPTSDAIDKVGRVIWGVLGVTAERDKVGTRARLLIEELRPKRRTEHYMKGYEIAEE